MPELHPPHRLPRKGRSARDHMEQAHGLDRDLLPRDPGALRLIQGMNHSVMADPSGAPAALVGSAEEKFSKLTGALDALVALDASMARDLSATYAVNLSLRYRERME